MGVKEDMADALIEVLDMFKARPDMLRLTGPAEKMILQRVANVLNAYNAGLPTAEDVRGILKP